MKTLTRFEKARLIGARALQLALGAPPLIKTDFFNPIEVSREEFRQGVVPISVVRVYPDGTEERVEELSWEK